MDWRGAEQNLQCQGQEGSTRANVGISEEVREGTSCCSNFLLYRDLFWDYEMDGWMGFLHEHLHDERIDRWARLLSSLCGSVLSLI